MAYPYSVFQGYVKAINRDEGRRTQRLMSAIRGARAEAKHFKAMWKELGNGNR